MIQLCSWPVSIYSDRLHKCELMESNQPYVGPYIVKLSDIRICRALIKNATVSGIPIVCTKICVRSTSSCSSSMTERTERERERERCLLQFSYTSIYADNGKLLISAWLKWLEISVWIWDTTKTLFYSGIKVTPSLTNITEWA